MIDVGERQVQAGCAYRDATGRQPIHLSAKMVPSLRNPFDRLAIGAAYNGFVHPRRDIGVKVRAAAGAGKVV